MSKSRNKRSVFGRSLNGGKVHPPAQRGSKSRSFEKLEDRHMLTAVQVEYEPVSLDDALDQIWERAADLSTYSPQELASANSWVVRAPSGTTANALRSQTGINSITAFAGASNTFIVNPVGATHGVIVDSLANAASVEYFYPELGNRGVSRSVPNDPLFSDQWHLLNTGQLVSQPDSLDTYATWGEDIRAVEAWDTATGDGVVIGIIDDGVYIGHPDLGASGTENFDPTKYSPDLSFNFNNPGFLPIPNTATDFHGTAVAGLAAGDGDNGLGITGVAYDATLAALRLIAEPISLTDQNIALALFHRPDDIDVYNNSWGPADVRLLAGPGPLAAQALMDSVLRGRTADNGVSKLGTIHVWAGGNGGAAFDSSNFDAYANSRYTISVGAVDHTGESTTYNETGTNILVTAPSGDGASGLTTTDLVGEVGYNSTGIDVDQIGRDFLADIDYTSRFNGTSAAAPIVSGVIALMLEAASDNGIELTYRDVEAILARSARQNDPTDIGWAVNYDPIWLNPIRDQGTQPQQPPLEPMDTSLVVGDGNEVPVAIPGVTAGMPDPTWLAGGNGLQDHFTGLNAPALKFVNGAGYSVHDTHLNAAQTYSYGHGVVDAALAVELASSWTSVGTNITQHTATTGVITFPATSGDIPQAEELFENGPWVPGSIGGEDGFGEWLAEFYNQDRAPFSEPDEPEFVSRGDYVYFPGPTDMSIEWVELEIDIDVDPEELSHLRIAIESPDGTQSDFNNHLTGVGGRPSFIGEEGNLTWTFSTTHHYGEKGSQEFVNPLTGVVEDKPWRLIIDNYSRSSTADLNTFQVNFYGSQVNEGRVKGFAGLDVDSDGMVFFPDDTANYFPGQLDQVLAGTRVWLDTNNNGFREANEPTQVTGADGNYYFDVPFGTWQVGIEIPDGFSPLNLTPSAINPNAVLQTVDVGLDIDPLVPDDVVSANFELVGQDITFMGTVFADVNNDGSGSGEPVLAGRTVYLDFNENGIFEDPSNPLEPNPETIVAVTEADGTWTITQALPPGYYTIAIAPEGGFTPSTPVGGFHRVYVEPGDIAANLDFGANPIEGAVTGSVYNDANGNGVQDGDELPVAGFEVYVDLDGDGTLGLGEPRVTTTEAGFAFLDLQYSTYDFRLLPLEGWEITSPTSGSLSAELQPGSIVSNVNFGVQNVNTTDFGDLDLSYGIASHGIQPGFYLGALVDGEPGTPSDAGAVGDDNAGMADDDGVVVGPIVASQTTAVTVTASPQSQGLLFLQGWIDFNNNGHFGDEGEHIEFRDAITGQTLGQQIRLQDDTNFLEFTAPAEVAANGLAARFRYGVGGSANFNVSAGHTLVGEVEDYLLSATISTSFIEPVVGDFDGSNVVDAGDYLVWQQTLGSNLDLRADANANGVVDMGDFAMWRDNLGAVATASLSVAPGAALSTATEEQPAGIGYVTVAGGDLASYQLSSSQEQSSSVFGGSTATPSALALDAAYSEEIEEEEEEENSFATSSSDSEQEALALALEDELEAV